MKHPRNPRTVNHVPGEDGISDNVFVIADDSYSGWEQVHFVRLMGSSIAKANLVLTGPRDFCDSSRNDPFKTQFISEAMTPTEIRDFAVFLWGQAAQLEADAVDAEPL